MESNTAYRQRISENLVEAVKKHARGEDIEVAEGGGTEFTVKLLSTPVAASTVELLPSEPSFQAHFCYSCFSLSNVTFTVSERDYDCLGIKTTKSFSSADEAAKWLIDMLSVKCDVAQV
ncbi:MAG: hypothetical protein ABSF64_28705 [Bryobacteraceae bacterium]|jgi:hypothetical protein